MQWSDEPKGGVSKAPPDQLTQPIISEGAYGYKEVNVAQEQRVH
jgi:maltose alpha-D-glucosyltransferase/alpha-amylase